MAILFSVYESGSSRSILHTSPSAVNGFDCIITWMYIVAIGWLYVTILVALNEPTVVSGIISFLFYGLLPCGLLLWMAGRKVRRQRRRYQELLADEKAGDNDRGDAKPDQ